METTPELSFAIDEVVDWLEYELTEESSSGLVRSIEKLRDAWLREKTKELRRRFDAQNNS